MNPNLKQLVAFFLIIFVAQGNANAAGDDFKVIVLGSGTPPPLAQRFGPSIFVQAGEQRFVFDAGRGASIRLWQKRISLGSVKLFLTHLHSDHVVGLPDIWMTGYLGSPFAKRKGFLQVYGPEGTANLVEHLIKAYEWDTNTRIADQKFKPENVGMTAHEVSEGVAYEKDGVKITAFTVNHGKLIKPALGYRIDYDGRSVVISGDTKYNENVIKYAKGVDLLLHQVAAARQELLDSAPFWKVIMDHHTKPDEAGRVFAQAQPKLAAFYHIVALTNGKIPPVKPAEILQIAGTTYSGKMLVSKDLMTFTVEKDKVSVSED